MRYFFIVIAFFFCLPVNAQKKTLEVIDATEIESLVISSDEIFKITISTSSLKEIRISTRADGEYFDEISLESELKEGRLILRSAYREILQSGYDKLSAHKVLSMEVELEIPEGMRVEIVSNVATVFGRGKYEELFIQLKSGSCYLEEFHGDAVVNTFSGNVVIKTSDAQVTASSRHGEVDVLDNSFGSNKIAVTSINGNISVQKTK